ncbi:transcription factor bHLH57-like [Malania oleifera]|uniref:transcription factor bHLH57-like n=1 Tax=Malania oleifera TaxID=397392 RepID=UPI0025AE7626|nr:transcription factor bHLH57-like [Malania oleifera]XP_057975090.1 transcription factor bHLH57-like [Malania oleifera]XP_057975091.1 transcription factor bHLH57-like [Malania oleifera]
MLVAQIKQGGERERESEAVMERLQGTINPSFFGEQLEGELCLEQESRVASELGHEFVDARSFRFEEETKTGLEDNMPFLQMLQSVESSHFVPFTEPSFQVMLLGLQHQKKPLQITHSPEITAGRNVQAIEHESCVTHDMPEMPTPVKSKEREHPKSRPPAAPCRERRKRKRTRAMKNKEEVETQRMTHIAVERNRRRQMNDHLNALKSLMPASYIQRGDQASIIGGAIDFVKQLEQLLQSLEAQKRMKEAEEDGDGCPTASSSTPFGCLFTAPQPQQQYDNGSVSAPGNKLSSSEAEIDVTVSVVQTHANMKIQCRRRPGQLLKGIVAMEDLRLTVLHLNITSSQCSVLYSFNLKIEEDCKLGSADEIAAAVHQIFSFINGSR